MRQRPLHHPARHHADGAFRARRAGLAARPPGERIALRARSRPGVLLRDARVGAHARGRARDPGATALAAWRPTWWQSALPVQRDEATAATEAIISGIARPIDHAREDALHRPARLRRRRGHAPGRRPATHAGPHEVLIEVAYAGVNRPDVAQRLGRYNAPPGASPVMGLEVAGTIVAIGKDVTSWRVGDAVCALTPGGGYAEFVVAPAAHCLPIPRGLGMLEAAALPENFFTVWVNVFDTLKLKRGETFLVHGGSSGIGLTAIQLAKAFGATVFTTAGSDEKTAFCRQHRRRPRVQLPHAGLRGRDRRDRRQARRRCDPRHGRRRLHQQEPEAPRHRGPARLHRLPPGSQGRGRFRARSMLKRQTITGSTLRARPDAQKAAIAASLREQVWPLLEQWRREAGDPRGLPARARGRRASASWSPAATSARSCSKCAGA